MTCAPEASAGPQDLLSRRRWSTPQRWLMLSIVVFGAWQVFFSLLKLREVQAAAMDLGYLEQVMWKISHGNWWAYSSVFQTPGIAGDGSVALYPLAYGFRYLGGSTFLFVVQAVGTGLATWGVYRAAVISKINGSMAVVLALAFMLAPGIFGGSQFDFHPDFVALPFMVWAYVAYRRGRLGPYYVLALAAILSKNMVLFGFLGWGVGLVVWERRWRDGLIALAGTLALMGLEFGWLIPHVWHASTQAVNARLYGYLGHNFVAIATGLPTHLGALVAQMFSDPVYWVFMLGATAGICLLGRAAVPAALALLLLNAASTLYQQHTVVSQYQVLLTGWIALATVEAVARWPRWRGRMVLVLAVTTALFQAGALSAGTLLPLLTTAPPGNAETIRQAAATIPVHTVVWAPDHDAAYLYRFPVFGQDHQAVPGLMVDGLPTLWREAGSYQTALLGVEPVSPYFAQVVGKAIRAGYRITYHHGRVFVVSGDRGFAPGLPQSYLLVNEPASNTWVFPSWAFGTRVGVVQWQQGVVAAGRRRGALVEPIRLRLNAGRYRVRVRLVPESPPGRTVGDLVWAGAVTHRFPIPSAAATVSDTVVVGRNGWVKLSITANGHGAFAVGNITVHRDS